ncbi:MAG: hypothetical protein MZW92_12785 [Comamonadaceae bacterium]|nr:hypothetical protein [Comamonadaceae bacterium]
MNDRAQARRGQRHRPQLLHRAACRPRATVAGVRALARPATTRCGDAAGRASPAHFSLLALRPCAVTVPAACRRGRYHARALADDLARAARRRSASRAATSSACRSAAWSGSMAALRHLARFASLTLADTASRQPAGAARRVDERTGDGARARHGAAGGAHARTLVHRRRSAPRSRPRSPASARSSAPLRPPATPAAPTRW